MFALVLLLANRWAVNTLLRWLGVTAVPIPMLYGSGAVLTGLVYTVLLLLRSRQYRRHSAPWVAAHRFILKERKLNHGGTEAQEVCTEDHSTISLVSSCLRG